MTVPIFPKNGPIGKTENGPGHGNPAQTLAERLGPARPEGARWRTSCPTCGGHNLTVGLADDGQRLLVYCWNGCSQPAVIERLRARGLWGGALSPGQNGHRPAASPVSPASAPSPRAASAASEPASEPAGRAANPLVWLADYCGVTDSFVSALPIAARGDWVAFTFPSGAAKLRRAGSKDIRWDIPAGAGRPALWPLPSPGEALPEGVWVLESETDAIVARRLGLAAYAVTAGASTPLKPAEAEALRQRGVRRATLVYDADAAGREGAQKQAEALARAGIKVAVVDLAEAGLVDVLAGEKDLRDCWRAAVARGESPERLTAALEVAARPWTPAAAGATLVLPPTDGQPNFQLPTALRSSVGSEVAAPGSAVGAVGDDRPAAGGLVETTAATLLRSVGTGDAGPLPSLPLLGRDGYLIRGWSHLVAGYPRAGKTELLAACALAWAQAGERVLYLTEEPASIWAARLARRTPSPPDEAEPDGQPNFQLPTALRSSVGSEVAAPGSAPGSATPTPAGGHGGEPAAAAATTAADPLDRLVLAFGLGVDPEQLLRRAVTGEETVVIVDTLRALIGIADETDNSTVAQALTPWIAGCRQMGKTLIMAHHERKGGGQHGEGIAGGHALLASFDVALELLRDGQHPDRRLIRPYARVIAPPELLYERTADGTFQALGDPEAVQRGEVRRRVRSALTETWQTTSEVWEGLDEPRPSRELVRAVLQDLAQAGEVERDPDVATTKVQGRTLRWRLAPALPRQTGGGGAVPAPSLESEPAPTPSTASVGPSVGPEAAAEAEGGPMAEAEAPPPPAEQLHFQRTFLGGLEVGSWAGGDTGDAASPPPPPDAGDGPPDAPAAEQLHFQRTFLGGLEVGSSAPPPGSEGAEPQGTAAAAAPLSPELHFQAGQARLERHLRALRELAAGYKLPDVPLLPGVPEDRQRRRRRRR